MKTVLTVSVLRRAQVSAQVDAPDLGALWLPQRQRRGLQVESSSGVVTLRRNGPRPGKRARHIRITTSTGRCRHDVSIEMVRTEPSSRFV